MDAGGGPDDDDANVLSPEELEFEDEEDVAPLGDDRYVIGANESPAVEDAPDADAEDAPSEPPPDDSTEAAEGPDGSGAGSDAASAREVKRWLAAELEDLDSDYTYHVTALSGDEVAHQQMATDDVGAAFDGLLTWYARQVAGTTPVDEALGILLGESSVRVRYPTATLLAYLEEHGLGPDDSIRELLDAVAEEDGLVFRRQR